MLYIRTYGGGLLSAVPYSMVGAVVGGAVVSTECNRILNNWFFFANFWSTFGKWDVATPGCGECQAGFANRNMLRANKHEFARGICMCVFGSI